VKGGIAMELPRSGLAVALLTIGAGSQALAAGDQARGQDLFSSRCGACHAPNALADPHIVIGSETLPDLIPVPFGGRDWLGPCRYADEFAEIGHAPHSVSFCDVRVERATLRKWLDPPSQWPPSRDAKSRPLACKGARCLSGPFLARQM
jgi:hypothetical protein